MTIARQLIGALPGRIHFTVVRGVKIQTIIDRGKRSKTMLSKCFRGRF
jgi:hypothetical protein